MWLRHRLGRAVNWARGESACVAPRQAQADERPKPSANSSRAKNENRVFGYLPSLSRVKLTALRNLRNGNDLRSDQGNEGLHALAHPFKSQTPCTPCVQLKSVARTARTVRREGQRAAERLFDITDAEQRIR